MIIKGRVWCLFEQSGTFKNEFKKLGYNAVDVDIQNNFNETDYVIDLFKAIENAYDGKPSLFDDISEDDLIIAFFPCIYFTGSVNPCYFRLDNNNYRCISDENKFRSIIDRAEKRNAFYILIYKLCGIIHLKKLRMVIENPFSSLHYLHNNFLKEPDIIDINRTRRGDYFKKPTGYWFFGCTPTSGKTYQKPTKILTVWEAKGATKAGICSEERSMISPDYARNFICDFILGKKQDIGQLTLF